MSVINILGNCPRCGKKGPHFVPPSFGTTGFYMCDPDDKPQPSRTPATYMMPCHRGCGRQVGPGDNWVEYGYGYAHRDCVPGMFDAAA